jgi:short subunit dehydrogenase-like uncharacterized protein
VGIGRFRYREVTGYGDGVMAPIRGAAMASAVVGLGAGMSFAPSRALLGRVLPAPGEGPSAKSRDAGFFRVAIHSKTSRGERYVARVAAKGDPGYAATSMMLGEAGMSLARDDFPTRGGVLTPATAIGLQLVNRLRRAGTKLHVARDAV